MTACLTEVFVEQPLASPGSANKLIYFALCIYDCIHSISLINGSAKNSSYLTLGREELLAALHEGWSKCLISHNTANIISFGI